MKIRLLAVISLLLLSLGAAAQPSTLVGVTIGETDVPVPGSGAVNGFRGVPSDVTIQDTFFGLKLGSVINESMVVKAVGSKGKYDQAERYQDELEYRFMDVAFAGSQWDFCDITVNEANQFMEILLYSSFDRFSSDERKTALSMFDNLKERLDRKYGQHDAAEKGLDRFVAYYGSNGVGLILSFDEGKSEGGRYYRYLKLHYFDGPLIEEASRADDEDL